MRQRIILALFLALTVLACFSQSFRGGIVGTVTDQTGAAIPAAQVTITNPQTGLTRTVTADAEGNYAVPELPIGNYVVSVKKEGFATATVKDLTVSVSANTNANITLQAGQVSQTIEVTASEPLVESTSDTMGGTIEGEQAAQLPVNGGDFTKLLVLVPGSVGDASGAADSPGSFGLFSSNGARGRSNNYLLDGTDMNDGYRNLPAINEAGVFGTPAVVLPIEAIAQVPVISGAEAEYGRNAGAIVNLVTKSGTNKFHGSAYEFFRNNALDARNYFNTKGISQDTFHNNQYGGSLGGPIVHDKTFFFFSYERQKERVGIPSLSHVPDPVTDIAANGGATNPVIAALLARHPWPLPNRTPDASGNNLQASTPGSNRVDSLIGKIDQHIGANDTFTGRYFFGDSDQSFPLALLGGNVLPGYNTITPTRAQVLSLSYTRVITPRLLLEIRGGWNRYAQKFLPQDRSFDPTSIGLVTTSNKQDFGLPLIAVSGFAPIGSNASLPRGRIDTNWQYFTNASYSTGGHNYKFGYEFRRTFVNGFFDAGYRSKISFASISDFLAGNITGSSRQAMGDSRRGTFQNNHAFYAQDSWKLSRKLTFNYGMRWDYFGVIGEQKHRFSIFDPVQGPVIVKQLYPRDLNNFSPRLSIAYDVSGSGKTVVRAGWGVFYDAFSQDFFVGQLPFNTFNPGPGYNGVGPSPILFSFSPVATIVPGQPVFPASSFSASDVFTVDHKLRTPYYENYNLNIQHQISKIAAVQVGYVGSSGRKLFRYRDINQTDPATGTHPFPAFGFVNQLETSASSNYNSLQTSLKLNASKRLNATFNYTWSHSIDNASDGQDYVPNATQPDNSFNTRAERANSNFDSRNHLASYLTFTLPDSHVLPKLLSGWSIDSVITHATGMPYNVTFLSGGDLNGSGEFFGRPDLVGNPFSGRATPSQYLNLSAFAAPCTFSGGACTGGQHFGNLRRNAFAGPAFTDFDLSLSKNTQITESVAMQIRIDAFNVLNHPNFTNPLLPSFGIDFAGNGLDPNTGRGIGFLGITATPDVGIGNPFLGSGGPRNLQLSVRFSF